MKKVLFAMMFFMLLCIWFALYQNGIFTTAKAIDGIKLKKKINYATFTNNFYVKEKYWERTYGYNKKKTNETIKKYKISISPYYGNKTNDWWYEVYRIDSVIISINIICSRKKAKNIVDAINLHTCRPQLGLNKMYYGDAMEGYTIIVDNDINPFLFKVDVNDVIDRYNMSKTTNKKFKIPFNYNKLSKYDKQVIHTTNYVSLYYYNNKLYTKFNDLLREKEIDLFWEEN